MPKKLNAESQAEQLERFRAAMRELEAAGELNPTEADERFEQVVRQSLTPRSK